MRITPDVELCETRATINETASLSRCYPDACSGFLLNPFHPLAIRSGSKRFRFLSLLSQTKFFPKARKRQFRSRINEFERRRRQRFWKY